MQALTSARSEAEFVAAAGDLPAARAFATRTWASLRAVADPDIEIRYISGGDVADRRDGSARAVAEVTWRAGAASGLDARTVRRTSVAFRVAPQQDGTFSIVDAGPRNGTLPVWLAGDVAVRRGDGTVVVTVDGGDPHLETGPMTAAARRAVLAVLPEAAGSVAVVSPSTQKQMADIVGQDVAEVEQIAAVTTRLDAREGSARGAVIVLNPSVFATMDARAAQVVLSHEATHLLTNATGSTVEAWVVEGFADYVALRDDTAPLSVSAGQVLAEVRAGALPDALPVASDFAAAGRGLGAVYESAWMVFRLLGQRYGSRATVAFYESVIDGTPIERALRASFGLTEERLTADWQAYLTKSASTVS
ncbi:MAG: hypothetical protein JWP31_1678 [Aeromicrobium sp.]|nr:hypothetical protein [Aeromicrobium sp.]